MEPAAKPAKLTMPHAAPILIVSAEECCLGGLPMENPVILSAVRTPVGKFMGGLSPLVAPELGAKVVAETVRRAGIEPRQVDEIIMGNVIQAGLGQNPARQAGLRGGLDTRVAAMTVNQVCGSGLKAVGLAAQSIALGESGNRRGRRHGVDVQ